MSDSGNGRAVSQETSPLGRRDIPDWLRACYPERGLIRAYMDWAVETTFADPYLHLGAILPPMAWLLNEQGFTWGEQRPFRILTGLVAGSGMGKSTALNRAKQFFDDWLRSLEGNYYRRPFLQLSGSIQGVTSVMATDHWREGAQATMPLLFTHELGQITRLPDAPDYLNQLWDGVDFARHTRQQQRAGEQSTVERPLLIGLFASTTEGLNSAVSSDQFSAGFFSRFLWFVGETEVPKGTFKANWSLREDLRQPLLRYWTSWKQTLDVDRARGASAHFKRPFCYGSSAMGLLDEVLLERIEPLLGGPIGGLAARLMEYAAELAAMYAASQLHPVILDEDAVAAANLCLSILDRIPWLHQALSPNASTRAVARVEQVIWAAGHTGIQKRDIYHRTGLRRKDLNEALEELEDAGKVRRHVYHNGKPGRPPEYAWHVDFIEDEESDENQRLH